MEILLYVCAVKVDTYLFFWDGFCFYLNERVVSWSWTEYNFFTSIGVFNSLNESGGVRSDFVSNNINAMLGR